MSQWPRPPPDLRGRPPHPHHEHQRLSRAQSFTSLAPPTNSPPDPSFPVDRRHHSSQLPAATFQIGQVIPSQLLSPPLGPRRPPRPFPPPAMDAGGLRMLPAVGPRPGFDQPWATTSTAPYAHLPHYQPHLVGAPRGPYPSSSRPPAFDPSRQSASLRHTPSTASRVSVSSTSSHQSWLPLQRYMNPSEPARVSMAGDAPRESLASTQLSSLNNHGGAARSDYGGSGGFDSGASGTGDRSFGGGSSNEGNFPADDGSQGGFAGGSGSGGDQGGADSDKDKSKKSNPLVDLMETEAAYVSELSKVIKKVAAAWSRSNFPPPELDTMFRNIEAIYRINRSFLKALKEIGPNPASPKALGDLLMRWIDDLEAPYAKYCDTYLCDFDSWAKVQSNPRLPALLAEISGPLDSEGNPVIFSDKRRDPSEPWTLDSLFGLPHIRLKYYKKLYSRLLKSTQPGRSDHRLLVGANEKLDDLLEKSKSRLSVSVIDEVAGRESQDSSLTESNTTSETIPRDRVSSATSASDGMGSLSPASQPFVVGKSLRSPQASPSHQPFHHAGSRAPPQLDPLPDLRPDSQLQPESPPRPAPPRQNSSTPVPSEDAASMTTSMDSKSKTNSLSSPIEDLERRLDTSRTLDIFTMKPKKCQLQMRPLNLPFDRVLRKSADVVINFMPSSGGPEVVIRRAHIFLLTDLFLVCERMTPSERAERSSGGGLGPDMWLLYPPLAGKHLRVADMGGQGNVMGITILKKEKLVVHVESREAKESWISHFDECQKFAGTLGLKVKTGSNLAPAPAPVSGPSAGAGSGSGSLSTPALSPAISVTPSSTLESESSGLPPPPMDPSAIASPHSSTGSSLARQASFTSVASFPKVPPSGSPDLRIPGINSPGSLASPRSPSPSQFAGPGPSYAVNGRPLPPGPPGPPMRPGMMSPNGLRSPETSPATGPMRLGPNGPMGPSSPAMGPGFHALGTGRPPMPNGVMPPRSPNGLGPGGPPSPGVRPFRGPSPIPGGPGMDYANGIRPPPPPPPNGMPQQWGPPNGFHPPPPPGHARDPMRRPSAPNLRAASHGSSNGRVSEEGRNGTPSMGRSRSVSSMGSASTPKLPSEMMKDGLTRRDSGADVSPPSSPKTKKGPVRSTVSAQMRCKLYLKQSHAQWKSLGNARLKLYHILPDDIKQLVVENDRKTLISTIVLTDGVERVGKVGVAVELSDQGNRTGIIYMLQMRSEESAGGLFGQLIEGSDRTVLAPR